MEFSRFRTRINALLLLLLALPLIVSAATFTRPLSVGSTGKDVAALQQLLYDKGYLTVQPTGYFGSLTKLGVQYFQRVNHLEAVGSVGPKTRALLNSKGAGLVLRPYAQTVVPTKSTTPVKKIYLQVGSSGRNVTTLQQILSDAGFFKTDVSGYFGQVTRAAVIAYQAAHNLSQTGEIDQPTLDNINAYIASLPPGGRRRRRSPNVGCTLREQGTARHSRPRVLLGGPSSGGLLLAGLPAHFESCHASHAVGSHDEMK